MGNIATDQNIPSEILVSSHAQIGSVTVAARSRDASNTVVTTLRKGMLLGKITASGKYMQFDQRSLLAADKAKTDTTVSVGSVVGFAVGDVISITDGTNTESKTITAINATAGTLTIGTTTNDYTVANASYVLLINGSELSAGVVVLSDQITGMSNEDVVVAVINHGVLVENKCSRTTGLDKSACQRLIWA